MREQGFFTTEEAIQEQATSVLSDFYALYEMEQYAIFDDPRDSFYYMHGLIADRLERAILTLASLARANDDGGEGFRLHKEKRPQGVGTLVEEHATSILTAREACNKIIHAKTAKFLLEEENGHPIFQELLVRDLGEFDCSYKRPKIQVTGERQGGKEWAAVIDVVLWIHAVMHYSTSYAKT